jgi:hypothetical protein
MTRTLLILNLLMVLVFQPVAATLLVPASMTDPASPGDLLTQSRHCPDRTAPGCADMETCSAIGYSSCDAQVAALPCINRFDAVELPAELKANVSNFYLLIPQGPPLRPPRYS